MIIPLAFFGVLGAGFFGVVKGSDVYRDALALAETHPLVIESLGEPIATGWQFQGSVNLEGNRGTADFSVPISGPKGSGRLYVEAEKRVGEWSYHRLEIELEDGSRLQLLEDSPLPEAPLSPENSPPPPIQDDPPRVLEEA
ncbi:MAG: cytochrome c oxidase assembly factor 1 family protein [Deltaproteobacteria bacterium]|nr:cytochrome c oxidase assembly factor 1 family protein [Deltaproteobacteria bacterium]